jgi:ATP-dependent DNA helicase PIF1
MLLLKPIRVIASQLILINCYSSGYNRITNQRWSRPLQRIIKMTQDEALAILENGNSVLLTGAAGTGKTYLLNKFIRRAKKSGKNVAVTATTGLAATHLNGNTIHSWAGIGIHDELPKKFFQKLSKQRKDIINKADILVIDEISMLHDFRLDMIDDVLQQVRGDSKAFGGMQVVLCGDFFQLPPINRKDSKSGGFIYGSEVWQRNNFTVCYLVDQYRQTNDADYSAILNGIRAGQLKQSQLDALNARRKAFVDPFTPRTRLLTTNADVDVINQQHLDKLSGEAHQYQMEEQGGKQYIEILKRSCLAPEILMLKKDAVVMCIKNAPNKSYVNGSLGVVVDFDKEDDSPIIQITNGSRVSMRSASWELRDGDRVRASITQLPIRLAWAITVHKSQGMTLDSASIDLSNAFVEGMGYVALSRVRGFKDLILEGLNGMALKTSPIARQIDVELRNLSKEALNK